MKKILLLSSICIILSGASLTLAQTTPTQGAAVPAPTTINQADPMTIIAKNIDRRIAYFNKYIKIKDMTSIAGLISEENKDFYDNIIKFIASAPSFTVKRDTAQNIIKTPQEAYMFSAIMSLGGKDAKITMTFIEESVDKNKKWALLDSNLHIVGKTLSPIQNTSTPKPPTGAITSNALNKNTPPAPTNIPQTSPAPVPVDNIVPTEATPAPQPTATKIPTVTPPKTPPPTALSSTTLSPMIIIAAGITLLLALLGGVLYFMRKRKNIGKALLAVQASAALSALPLADTAEKQIAVAPSPLPLSETTPQPEDTKIIPEPAESNVSLVEAEVPMTTTSPDSPENIGADSSPETTPNSLSEASLSMPASTSSDIPPESVMPTEESLPKVETINNPPEQIQEHPSDPVIAPSDTNTTATPPHEESGSNDISVLSEVPEAEQPSVTNDSLSVTPGVSPSVESSPTSNPPELVIAEDSPFYTAPVQPANNLDPDPLFAKILSPESSTDSSPLFGNIL